MNIVVMQERHLAALAEIERACFHAPWSALCLVIRVTADPGLHTISFTRIAMQ